ncbi:MAG: hypothetical protein ABFS28_04460 [Bacteroidota bacterium]
MEDQAHNKSTDFVQLRNKISELEQRIARLEKQNIPSRNGDMPRPFRTSVSQESEESPKIFEQDMSIESRIGEYGMAWLGNVVLLFGILFLTQLLQKNGQVGFSLAFSFISLAGIYMLGYYTKRSFPYMSQLFIYNGHIMLFIIAMRIHVFPGSRIIDSALLGYGIVMVVILALMYLAFRNKSQVLAVLVWIMTVITAIYSDSTHFMLALMLGVTWSAIFFASRNSWWIGLIISIVMVYFTFLLWIMSNPFISGSFEIIPDHQNGFIYLFICALSYSFLALFSKSERVKELFLQAGILLNGIGFSFILTLAVLAFFTKNYYIHFGIIAAFCMVYSIWLQSRGIWKSVAAMYAIYGFVSLSISIAGIYHFPLAFLLLSIQSLLVVSMALWFRSRFIVIMNTLLFMGLLITYLATAESIASTNLSFALVALITARIMNWKKKRLEIRTELIRNVYLFTGSVMLLYSLHHAVPTQFVTLSWALTAMLFFLLSVWIKNIKYRWLAIITMVITVFYLFIVDLKNISLGYRIVALLFISIISLGISIFYTRRQRHKEEEKQKG